MKGKSFDHMVTIVLLLICIALAGVTIKSNLESKANSQKGPLQAVEQNTMVVTNVSVEAASRGDFVSYTSVGAEIIDKNDEVNLLSEYEGKVTKIYVSEDEEIHIGDLICTIDNSKPGSEYKAKNIVSVVDGKIEDIPIYVGETLSTSSTLLTVQPTPDLRVSAQLPEKYLSILSEGMVATFTTQAWPDEPIAAVLSHVGDKVDTTNRAVTIELKPKDSSKLLSGMYVSLQLKTQEVDDALLIPTGALSTYFDQKVVYVVKDNIATRTAVTTGLSNSTVTIITDGLEEGDQVITAGSVTDQAHVNIV